VAVATVPCTLSDVGLDVNVDGRGLTGAGCGASQIHLLNNFIVVVREITL